MPINLPHDHLHDDLNAARSAVQRLEAENEDLKMKLEHVESLVRRAHQEEMKARAQVEVLNDTIQQLFSQMRH